MAEHGKDKPLKKWYTDQVEVAVWPFSGQEAFHRVTVHAYFVKNGERIETTQWNAGQLLILSHLTKLAARYVMKHRKKE